MLTREEAIELAGLVQTGKVRTYVGAAKALAEYLLQEEKERRALQEAAAETVEALNAARPAIIAAVRQEVDELTQWPRCDKAPVGWQCTRAANHEGPCAAVEAVIP